MNCFYPGHVRPAIVMAIGKRCIMPLCKACSEVAFSADLTLDIRLKALPARIRRIPNADAYRKARRENEVI